MIIRTDRKSFLNLKKQQILKQDIRFHLQLMLDLQMNSQCNE